jgi:hypothetical protein
MSTNPIIKPKVAWFSCSERREGWRNGMSE